MVAETSVMNGLKIQVSGPSNLREVLRMEPDRRIISISELFTIRMNSELTDYLCILTERSQCKSQFWLNEGIIYSRSAKPVSDRIKFRYWEYNNNTPGDKTSHVTLIQEIPSESSISNQGALLFRLSGISATEVPTEIGLNINIKPVSMQKIQLHDGECTADGSIVTADYLDYKLHIQSRSDIPFMGLFSVDLSKSMGEVLNAQQTPDAKLGVISLPRIRETEKGINLFSSEELFSLLRNSINNLSAG